MDGGAGGKEERGILRVPFLHDRDPAYQLVPREVSLPPVGFELTVLGTRNRGCDREEDPVALPPGFEGRVEEPLPEELLPAQLCAPLPDPDTPLRSHGPFLHFHVPEEGQEDECIPLERRVIPPPLP